MAIAPIDESDLDRHAPETADGLKAAEASPYNDHPMSFLGFAHQRSLPVPDALRGRLRAHHR
jgi:hypothetical protein